MNDLFWATFQEELHNARWCVDNGESVVSRGHMVDFFYALESLIEENRTAASKKVDGGSRD